MKCHKCKIQMVHKKLEFNGEPIKGWSCRCGEKYYDPDQAQKILLLHKLRQKTIRAKLGKIRSNLILRLPKDVEVALNLQKGEDVLIKVEEKGIRILPT